MVFIDFIGAYLVPLFGTAKTTVFFFTIVELDESDEEPLEELLELEPLDDSELEEVVLGEPAFRGMAKPNESSSVGGVG
uniref:Uncharacterized protein n=1 Tax=Acrobeloides nanus TaxID=290746 RepID=A0A914DBB8_9BILA